jgi:hypothetical protein
MVMCHSTHMGTYGSLLHHESPACTGTSSRPKKVCPWLATSAKPRERTVYTADLHITGVVASRLMTRQAPRANSQPECNAGLLLANLSVSKSSTGGPRNAMNGPNSTSAPKPSVFI